MKVNKAVSFVTVAVLIGMVGGCSMGVKVEVEIVDGISFLHLTGGPATDSEREALFVGTLGVDADNCAVLIDADKVEHGLILPSDAEVTLRDEQAEVQLSEQTYRIGDDVSFGGGFSKNLPGIPEDCAYDAFFIPNSNQPTASTP